MHQRSLQTTHHLSFIDDVAVFKTATFAGTGANDFWLGLGAAALGHTSNRHLYMKGAHVDTRDDAITHTYTLRYTKSAQITLF